MKYAFAIIGCLAVIYLVSAVSEYVICVEYRMHWPTNGQDVWHKQAQSCKLLHLYSPFTQLEVILHP